MLAFLDDARFAFRQMRRRAGSTLAGLATLVLGIGAATAVFTVVQAVLLRPLPYSDAHRLVTAWQTFPHCALSAGLLRQWGNVCQAVTSRCASL